MDGTSSGDICACAEPYRPVRATTVAIVVLIAVILIYFLASHLHRRRREGFVSQRAHEVCAKTREVFGQNQDAKYSDFKTRVPGADAVLYTDMRSLWKAGSLTPESVQKSL